MKCSEISELIRAGEVCDETPRGLRVRTDCLYPSFEPVFVYVRSHLHGIVVTDGGDSVSRAWSHGRDAAFAKRQLSKSSLHFGCEFANGELSLIAPSQEWLPQAIAAVANAASQGASAAVRHVSQSTEGKLISRIYKVLEKSPHRFEATLEHQSVGKSGKTHRYDMLVSHGTEEVLVNVVVPHPNSIAAKYLALADAEDVKSRWKYAVYDRNLSGEDKALLSNVADVIPFSSISETQGKAFLVH